MGTKRLANSNLFITPIGLGAWAIGGPGWEFAWAGQDDRDSITAILGALSDPKKTGQALLPDGPAGAAHNRASPVFLGPAKTAMHRIGPAAACTLGPSPRAGLARLRGVDGGHLGRAGWIDGYHGAERVTTGEPVGRVTQRAKEAEFGAVVVTRGR